MNLCYTPAMTTDTISTKQLRDELPRIRRGVAQGKTYTIIYRSQPFAELRPIEKKTPPRPKLTGGGMHLQSRIDRKLTPEYFNEIAATLYD